VKIRKISEIGKTQVKHAVGITKTVKSAKKQCRSVKNHVKSGKSVIISGNQQKLDEIGENQ
jgi:hypothetical protein